MNCAVILDRDGVINEDSDDYIKSVEEYIPVEGSLDAILDLKESGFLVAVATNQAGIARGYLTLEALLQMHAHLEALLQEKGVHLDGIEFCPHHPDEGCVCRKPAPGMLLTLQKRLGFDPNCSYFIGDSITDIQAARGAGLTPILVQTGKGQRTIDRFGGEIQGVERFKNLKEAARSLIERNQSARPR